MDFDCDKLSDNTAAALSIAEKKVYLNELFAEKFTVYLLMPETFVREEFAKFNSSRLSRCFSAEDNLTTMANIFCVSRQAMRIRLSQYELTLIYVSKDGKCYRSYEKF